MIWLELCTTYSSSSPVVTTTSVIHCLNKHWQTQVHLENGCLNGRRERERECCDDCRRRWVCYSSRGWVMPRCRPWLVVRPVDCSSRWRRLALEVLVRWSTAALVYPTESRLHRMTATSSRDCSLCPRRNLSHKASSRTVSVDLATWSELTLCQVSSWNSLTGDILRHLLLWL